MNHILKVILINKKYRSWKLFRQNCQPATICCPNEQYKAMNQAKTHAKLIPHAPVEQRHSRNGGAAVCVRRSRHHARAYYPLALPPRRAQFAAI